MIGRMGRTARFGATGTALDWVNPYAYAESVYQWATTTTPSASPIPQVGASDEGLTPQRVAQAPEIVAPRRVEVAAPGSAQFQTTMPTGARAPTGLPTWAKVVLGLVGASMVASLLGLGVAARRRRRRR